MTMPFLPVRVCAFCLIVLFRCNHSRNNHLRRNATCCVPSHVWDCRAAPSCVQICWSDKLKPQLPSVHGMSCRRRCKLQILAQ